MMADLILGIDVGTTAVKLVVIAADGTLMHGYSENYPIHRHGGALVEQDPDDWVHRMDAGIAGLVAKGLAPRICAIGVTSQVNTHVFLDASGRPLVPAIVWQDGRAEAEALALEARVSVEQKLAWFGAPIPIDASHPLSRMAWMRRHRPEVWAATRWVVLPKDLCLHHLTGEMHTDAVSNVGIANENGFVAEVLALVPGAAERLAPLCGPAEVAGVVKHGALKGVPVVTCTMDGWCSIFGAAGAQDGSGTHVSGTSEIMGIVSRNVTPTPGVVVFPELSGLRIHAGPTQSGGASLAWFCNWAGLTPERAGALVSDAPRRALTPLFLPHISGERAPLWNGNLRGAFLGLDASCDLADLARAVMEGVGFSARHALEALETSAGVRPDHLTCGGGGFRSAVWTQIKANIMGRPMVPLAVNEPGLLGACALAAFGADIFPSLATAQSALVTHLDPVLPDPDRRGLYDDLFGLYTEAVDVNAALHARLVASAAIYAGTGTGIML